MIEALPTDSLMELVEKSREFDVIGIDEGQFFPDIVPFCDMLASEGKIVVVAALDGTFQRKPFGTVLELIPLAESVCKLTAVCKGCFSDAAFTKRLGAETAVEVIGGSEMYLPVCRQCYEKQQPFRSSPGKRGA
mmetsp:Transcript_24835/g.53824  ORF Transcript_24835/g.53824 Transcript_24835/m.53824 type:complete len:134 (+) Transcript_24835:3-404(+)